PWVRLGAPGMPLPSGVGVELGAGSVGTGTSGVALGVGTDTGPLSMTCLIGPLMPGMLTWLTGVPGGTSTVVWTRTPETRTTVTEWSWAAAGIAATPRT